MDNNISHLEWNGLKSQKFVGSRKHVQEYHQSFEQNDRSRKHFTNLPHQNESVFQKTASENLLKGKKVFPSLVTRETVPKPFLQKSSDRVPVGDDESHRRVQLSTVSEKKINPESFSSGINPHASSQYLTGQQPNVNNQVPKRAINK